MQGSHGNSTKIIQAKPFIVENNLESHILDKLTCRYNNLKKTNDLHIFQLIHLLIRQKFNLIEMKRKKEKNHMRVFCNPHSNRIELELGLSFLPGLLGSFFNPLKSCRFPVYSSPIEALILF